MQIPLLSGSGSDSGCGLGLLLDDEYARMNTTMSAAMSGSVSVSLSVSTRKYLALRTWVAGECGSST